MRRSEWQSCAHTAPRTTVESELCIEICYLYDPRKQLVRVQQRELIDSIFVLVCKTKQPCHAINFSTYLFVCPFACLSVCLALLCFTGSTLIGIIVQFTPWSVMLAVGDITALLATQLIPGCEECFLSPSNEEHFD